MRRNLSLESPLVFEPPVFSPRGLVWPSPTSEGTEVPLDQDERLAFTEWALPMLRRKFIGNRMVILVLTGSSKHDRQLLKINEELPFAAASVQVIGQVPTGTGGWSGRTRQSPRTLTLPFRVLSSDVAFLWITRVYPTRDRWTTGFRVRYASRHRVGSTGLRIREVDLTLEQWCEVTGSEPGGSRSGAA